MAAAEVGDDVYGEDPTVNRLEEVFAALVGTETALFVPSGTMGNQLCLRLLTEPGDEVVVGREQHLVRWEEGASEVNAGVRLTLVDDTDGTIAVPVGSEAAPRRPSGWRRPRPRPSPAACPRRWARRSGR